ncbi:MAG: hypothetical protein IK132_11765 [Clostridia bacterium]|nr:hypothetical protein [Clostridia bacterium]
MRKHVSILLSALLLAASLHSCAGSEPDPAVPASDPVPQIASETVPETEPDRAHTPDSLPALDFGGATTVIHARGDNESLSEIYSEELNGEAVNDAIFERNVSVEERLNVSLQCFAGDGWENYDNTVSAIRASIQSADGSYDIVAGWSSRIPALSLEGVFLDLNGMNYLDPGQNWWNASAIRELQVGNRLYFVTGDIAKTMLSSMCVYVFNQKVAEDNHVENLYEVVREHRWTLDYVYALTSQLYRDLNGNGEKNLTDFWGLVTSCINDADAYMQGSLVSMMTRDEEGWPVLSVDEEQLADLVSKVYRLDWENPGCYAITDAETNVRDTIAQDKALLASTRLAMVVGSLGDMESDYGVLPYPMLNEAQESYGTRVQDALSLWCIPIDAKDPDLSAAVMEALAAQSWRTVTPAYFDIALKSRYSRDPETSAMMDLIKDSVYINFESLYNRAIGQPWFVLRNLMPQKDKNFASYWASNKKLLAKNLDKAIKKLKDLD